MKVLLIVFLLISTPIWGQSPTNNDVIDDLKSSGTDDTSDQLNALKAELLIAKNEKKAMVQIKNLLKKYRGSGMEGGLWFRLAELYMRRSKADRFFEINRESETIVKLAPKLIKNASAKSNIIEAIQIYDKIEKKFSDFRDLDLVYYNSGFARQQISRNAEAKAQYQKLLRNFKDSPLIPDTHLALGEMYFDEQKYEEARNQFESIKKFPESRIYPYGRYKLAWTLYNLTKVEEGLLELEAVVKYSKDIAQEGAENRLDLLKESLTDMVLFYSEKRESVKAVDYFVSQAGKKEAGFYILKLMKLYNRHGKLLDEAKLFYKLREDLDTDPILPLAYVSIIGSYEDQRRRDKAIFEIESFSNLCDVEGSWGKANIDSASFLQCQDLVKNISFNYAAKWHKLWKKNVTHLELAQYAERSYKNFLRWDETSDKAILLRFDFANLLFEMKKLRESSAQYFLVAKAAKKQPMIHQAAYGAIFALQKAVGDKWTKEDELRYVELAGVYISRNPAGKYKEDIEFKRAFIIYDSGRYQEAAPLLVDLGERYKNKPQGIRAQDLYLDILAKLSSFVETKNYSRKLIDREKDEKRKEKLKKVYQESYFASIDLPISKEEGKDPLEKSKDYLKFAKENMDSPLAEKAWWNSVQLLKSNAGPKQIAETSYEFSKTFPKSPLRADALKIATQNFEWITDLSQAAETSKILIKLDTANSFSWKKLSVDYLSLSSQEIQAESILKESLNSKNTEEQVWALENLYLMAKEKKDKSKEDYYEKFVLKSNLQPYSGEILQAEIKNLIKAKDYTNAFKKSGELLTQKNVPQSNKAFARFTQSEILKKELVNQSLVSTAERVAIVIGLKTERLEKAQRAYQATAKIGDANYTVESYIGLAECYGDYARSLRNMRLKDVSEADSQVFFKEIESLVIPMEEREVETLMKALEFSQKLKLRNGSVRRIRIRLDELNLKNSIYFPIEYSAPGIMAPDLSEVKL